MLACDLGQRSGTWWEGETLEALFQPIENVMTSEIVGFEALARVRRHDALLTPDAFLPRLDRQGLMTLFLMMVENANTFLKRVDGRSVYVSVNVEVRLLEMDSFVASLADTLREQDYRGSGLVLEVLESEKTSDLGLLQDVLSRIKALGICIALDDLGSGFSSLLNLRNLPIDIMKLDQAFARGLPERPDDLQYIASLLSLAKGLKKRLIVEGVETDDIREAVRVLGVEFVQGYAIAKPMPVRDVDDWLQARNARRGVDRSPSSQLISFARQIRSGHAEDPPSVQAVGTPRAPAPADGGDGGAHDAAISSRTAGGSAGFPATHRFSIAVIDDDPVYRTYLTAMAETTKIFSVHEGSCGDDLQAILEIEKIDCIVLDYNLEGDSGFAVKERLQQRFKDLPPVLLLTGDERQSTVIKAMRLGIQDYLPKAKLTSNAFIDAVTRVVAADVEKRQTVAEYRRLLAASHIDPFTGLSSRRRVEERISQVAELAPSATADFALVAIVLPEWREIVSSFGFDLANRALRAFAERLQLCGGPGNICGRYADGTFMMVLDLRSVRDDLAGFCASMVRQLSFKLETSAATLVLSARMGVVPFAEAGTTGSLIASASDALADASSAPYFRIADGARRASETEASAQSKPVHRNAEMPALRKSDRRREQRRKVLRRGRILSMNRTSLVDCAVKNMSLGGAGLLLHAVMVVPEEFLLEIVGFADARRVRVRWQAGLALGVEYDV